MTGVMLPASSSSRSMAMACSRLGTPLRPSRSRFTKRERKTSLSAWGMIPRRRPPAAPYRSCPMSTYFPSGSSARLHAENGWFPGMSTIRS